MREPTPFDDLAGWSLAKAAPASQAQRVTAARRAARASA